MNDLLIFAYADSKYEKFVLAYIYYALKSNPRAVVEIILDNYYAYKKKNEDAIIYLKKIYTDKFLIRQAKYGDKVSPNTIRFIEEPVLKAKYLYIGDIDLLIFEDLMKIHLNYIQKYDLPFSNVLRKKKSPAELDKLSGLHFCKYDLYYPIPDLSDIDLMMTNDEHVLYTIMKRKEVMVPRSFQERPECGIHMSLSRDPLGRYTNNKKINYSYAALPWGGNQYYKLFLDSLKDKTFLILSQYFEISFEYLLLVLKAIVTENFAVLQMEILSFGYNKRLLSRKDKVVYEDLLQEKKILIDNNNLTAAALLIKEMLLIWPKESTLYLDLAMIAIEQKKFILALESYQFVFSLPNGIETLNKSELFLSNISKFNALESILKKNQELKSFLNYFNPYKIRLRINTNQINKRWQLLSSFKVKKLLNTSLIVTIDCDTLINKEEHLSVQVLLLGPQLCNYYWTSFDIKDTNNTKRIRYTDLKKIGDILYEDIQTIKVLLKRE